METSRLQSPQFGVSSRMDGDAAVIELVGELDEWTRPCVDEEIHVLGRAGVTQFTVDATGLTFVGVSGVHALVALLADPPAAETHAQRQARLREVREVVELRRAVSPLTDDIEWLNSANQDLLSKEVRRRLRDVLDHQIVAAEQIAEYDEMLSSLVQAALAKVGMQQNQDMRKISAWAAMAAVPTAIAGIYGMNFENMPELGWQWGYPAVLLLMVTICGFLYRTFRRNHWL